MKFDEEEEMILSAIENDEVEARTPSKEDIEFIKETAKNTFKKNKSITIRLYEHDYVNIQKKAMEMGIPYQTLISGLIHRYVEGDVSLKTVS
ncbi:hypothetical protein EW093_15630 [Thiospirochaeta perfilievii]|uniref:Antitoxin n=1 Tax=Thiospirochaeta perfilievii TaxID=252967 RepID=A0A5C1QHL5_9SPIO|nr:hypothetical protein [Thiospirochaeta perfilievii]QEN06056.1 hypothetical protein EW093_15630 [Thiospirochaeta perfilievii]